MLSLQNQRQRQRQTQSQNQIRASTKFITGNLWNKAGFQSFKLDEQASEVPGTKFGTSPDFDFGFDFAFAFAFDFVVTT